VIGGELLSLFLDLLQTFFKVLLEFYYQYSVGVGGGGSSLGLSIRFRLYV
jgi:hypothetical protein